MSEAHSTAIYKPINGFPGYRVGDDGTVWSLWSPGGRGGGRKVAKAWRQLRQGIEKVGAHRYVVLSPGNKHRKVHRLVLEAFIGSAPPGMECRHFPDRDPGNNRLNNLQWGTRKENSADRYAHGTMRLGTKSNFAKLRDSQIRRIKKFRAAGRSQDWIARYFKINQGNVSRILAGKTWGHVS